MNCPYVMRRCNECGEIKFLFKFHKNGKHGFKGKCKQCKSKYQKQYRKEHKEEITEYRKEHKKEMAEYGKKYREEHKEEKAEYDKKYYKENKEKRAEYDKEYRHTLQGQIVQFNKRNRRRSKEKKQGNGLTKVQWLEMMKFFDFKCAYSNIYIGDEENNQIRSIDHIIALDNGGLNEIWNCVPMYKPYNSSKQTSDMLEWYQQQDFYSEERLQKIYEWQEYAYNKWGKESEVC